MSKEGKRRLDVEVKSATPESNSNSTNAHISKKTQKTQLEEEQGKISDLPQKMNKANNLQKIEDNRRRIREVVEATNSATHTHRHPTTEEKATESTFSRK